MTDFKNVWKHVTNFLGAAMYWIGFGLKVIPILPGAKKPALKWDPWLKGLDPQKVYQYWTENPGHEVGCIVGDDLIVLDADTPESVSALADIEKRYDLTPKLVVKTAKGVHHYYRRTAGTLAKSDSHDSEKYPDRIDIKTGRALVVMPISTGKSLTTLEAENKDELSEAPQKFIDAIYEHNGRTVPAESVKLAKPQEATVETGKYKFETLLKSIDPDCGYDDWLRVGMAIFHETKGSDYGLAVFRRWSSKGTKYKGSLEIEKKWSSFRLDEPNPVTIGSLVKMAADADDFEPCEFVQIQQEAMVTEDFLKNHDPLDQHSIKEKPDELKQDDATGLVKGLSERVKDDCGALLEPESIAALAEIKKSNAAEFSRIRKELKKANKDVSLTQLDAEIKGISLETHHGYATDIISRLTIGEWPPKAYEGDLYRLGEDNLWVKYKFESTTKLVAETHDGKPNCQRKSDYSGIASHTIMIATDDTFFADAPTGLATPDGFIQIKNNEIITEPLSPSHRQRVKITVTPKDEETPLFNAFLHETFKSDAEEEEKQQLILVQEIFGAIMVGIMAMYQKAVLFYDKYGRAGKGTLERMIAQLVPRPFITAVSPFQWDDEYYRASLIGSRFNTVGELPESKPIPAAVFKSVTGGDLLSGRHPSGRPITFKNEAAHLFMSNHLINTPDHSEAFFSRWLIVEFPNSRLRTGLPLDPGLAERIIEQELPGIAYWALIGAKRLMENGSFSSSIVHDRLMAKWRRSTNSLEEFIFESCELVDQKEHMRRSDFYREYKEWCNENGRKPFAKGRVFDLIAHNFGLGITHTKLDGYDILRGVKLKEECSSDSINPDFLKQCDEVLK